MAALRSSPGEALADVVAADLVDPLIPAVLVLGAGGSWLARPTSPARFGSLGFIRELL
jgi:hypothetical protein